MYNPESVQENEMHKLLWDIEIQTDHQIFDQMTRPCESQQKKKENQLNSELCYPGRPQSRILKKIKKRD